MVGNFEIGVRGIFLAIFIIPNLGILLLIMTCYLEFGVLFFISPNLASFGIHNAMVGNIEICLRVF